MNIVNLTPHTLTLYNEAHELVATILPSGTVARVTATRKLVGEINNIPLYRTTYGEVIDLPDQADNTIYVVSGIIRAAVHRSDLWQPGELIRNDVGQPIGAIGLSQ